MDHTIAEAGEVLIPRRFEHGADRATWWGPFRTGGPRHALGTGEGRNANRRPGPTSPYMSTSH